MEIRLAQGRDIPGMIALLYQVGEVHHVIRPDIFRNGALKYDENELENLLCDENKPIFVADADGFVAGYCFCQIRSYGDTVQTERKELYIDDLCVDENLRGQHIGRTLYEAALKLAKDNGCYNVTLNVWSCNPSALKFYESLGMKPQKIGMETIL